MNILVWQQYGNVKAYAAETPAHFIKIFDELRAVMSGWGEDEKLDELYEAMGKSTSLKVCQRHFMGFVYNHLRTHESFEVFEFTTVENA
jgi:hypothetical protein